MRTKQMKMVGMALSVMLLGAMAQAQDLSKGRNELGLTGNIRLDEPDPIDYQIDVAVKYGRFVRDRLQVGANIGVAANDLSWTLSLGPYAEYNFDIGRRWPAMQKVVPFVGLGIALATAELKDLDIDRGEGLTKTEDSTGVALNGEVGVKYFISDSVALTASFDYAWASDDVFGGSSDAKNILLGIRAYF